MNKVVEDVRFILHDDGDELIITLYSSVYLARFVWHLVNDLTFGVTQLSDKSVSIRGSFYSHDLLYFYGLMENDIA